jgi:transcriptional antiterminator RfaH
MLRRLRGVVADRFGGRPLTEKRGAPLQSWYVAKTKPHREHTTAAILAQRDVEVYLPSITFRRRDTLRTALHEPLFPGYLFARLDLNADDWLATRSAPGIAYFLGGDGAPTALPDGLIEGIRARVERSRSNWQRPAFEAGERVVLERGPFAGLDAIFDDWLSARGRVRVLLEIVERLVPVDVDVDMLRPPRRATVNHPVAV